MQQKGQESHVSPSQIILFLVALARSYALSAVGEGGPARVMVAGPGASVDMILQVASGYVFVNTLQ